MRIDVIMQARMSSSRLPGKTLRKFRDKTILEYQISALRRVSSISDIIIATSTDPSDDAIVDFCLSRNIPVLRGSLTNVAERFKDALITYLPDAFVRFCADRPFYDPEILDRGIKLFLEEKHDIVTNVLKPTFPKGQTTEIINTATFLREFSNFSEKEHLEHPTSYFYDRKDLFKILNFENDRGNFSDVNLCIDTEEDFLRFAAICQLMDRPLSCYNWREIVSLYREVC